MLFVLKKGDSKLRIVINYRTLNEDTIKNRYLLLLIAEMREWITKVNWFFNLDFLIRFNYVRVKEGDEYKTAFRTYNRHYQYRIMPIRLTNAPVTF